GGLHGGRGGCHQHTLGRGVHRRLHRVHRRRRRGRGALATPHTVRKATDDRRPAATALAPRLALECTKRYSALPCSSAPTTWRTYARGAFVGRESVLATIGLSSQLATPSIASTTFRARAHIMPDRRCAARGLEDQGFACIKRRLFASSALVRLVTERDSGLGAALPGVRRGLGGSALPAVARQAGAGSVSRGAPLGRAGAAGPGRRSRRSP